MCELIYEHGCFLIQLILYVWQTDRHFKNWVNIWCEFIPQVVFLLSIFGYMNFMIFWKWFKYDSTISGRAPSILITLINMFLMKSTDPNDMTQPAHLREELYPYQSTVQLILLLMAVLCIPWMLAIKPFWLKHTFNKK